MHHELGECRQTFEPSDRGQRGLGRRESELGNGDTVHQGRSLWKETPKDRRPRREGRRDKAWGEKHFPILFNCGVEVVDSAQADRKKTGRWGEIRMSMSNTEFQVKFETPSGIGDTNIGGARVRIGLLNKPKGEAL